MSRIIVINNLTLDGVMQAPARPDEDVRGGFAHGGWAVPYGDEVMAKAMGARMANPGPLLLGRRTYEDFFSVWPHRTDNPYTEVLNNTQKYVVSTTLTEPLPWQNSTLLTGDVATSVAELKRRSADDIGVLGSGRLVQSLIAHDLVDEYVLLIYPLVLGTGRRMFPDDAKLELRLADSITTTTGVVIATYRPATSDPR
ncbi:MAG TPA: dihydrofolate reductase family protein [Streptosporangiaceae bacterium]|jgi:dihydrofolate reductase